MSEKLEEQILKIAETPEFSESTEISPEIQKELEKEVKLEEKYGDQSLKAGALGAARGLTFGLSDVALRKSGILSEEELRELDERNKAASVGGEVAGVIAPSLLTGGTGAVARGAQTATTGIRGATRAGQAVERAAAEALKKVLKKDTVAQQIVKNSIPKAAGSAVEGTFYGTGELLSEDALGRAEFNAENLASSAGLSALIGGGAGGIFGTAQSIVPIVKGGKIVDYASKRLKPGTDVETAAAKLSGLTPSKITKLKAQRPEVINNLPNFYRTRLDLKKFDSAEKLAKKTSESIDTIGKEIDDTLTKIDDLATVDVLPTKAEVGQKIQTTLSQLQKDFQGLPSTAAKRNLRKIQNEMKAWDSWSNNAATLTAKEVQELKTRLQRLAKWEKSFDKLSLDEKMAREASEAVRSSMFDIAERVSTVDKNLAEQLRQANLDYGTAMTITESLSKKADREAIKDFAGFKDLIFADVLSELGNAGLAGLGVVGKKYLESDYRRRIQILKQVEKANKKADNKITSGIKNFLTKPQKAARPTSMKILTESTYATPENSDKKPKNRQEAFKNIKNNLETYAGDPEILIDRLTRNGIRMEKVAPNTTNSLKSTVLKGVTFLQNKLPRDASPTIKFPALQRPSQPSSLELAKFERYVEGVDNPLSVIDDLEEGTLTREKVEAIRFVYPDLYLRIQQKVMDDLSESETEVPYQKRLQLGILLDIPTDASLEPQNILGLQETFQIEPDTPEAEQATVKPTMTGLGKVKISEGMKTPMQKAISKE